MTVPAPGDPLAPIGVFDSGLGGLTVVDRIREQLPAEKIIYVADQFHVPYGGRELSVVRDFACGISAALILKGCKAIVMACNISSATALDCVQSRFTDRPVMGVIEPGARAALALTRTRRIGVLATVGTVRSEAYTRTIRALDSEAIVTESPCPEFVPLVERGELDTAAARRAAAAYLEPLQESGADVVILGCTHYPFLLPVLHSCAERIGFVDPAEHAVRTLMTRLAEAGALAPADSAPRHQLITTGDPQAFASQMDRFFPAHSSCAAIEHARWQAEDLLLP